jgi:hypothetical protein
MSPHQEGLLAMQITATRTQSADQDQLLAFNLFAPMTVPAKAPAKPEIQARTTTTDQAVQHDMQEVAARFNRPQVASFGVETILKTGAMNSDFNTTTMGKVTFRNVAPLEASRAEIVTADVRLQAHLETLCDSLRSRY